MDVSVLLEPKIDMPRLAEVLDGLGHEGRVHAIRSWGLKRQIAIYEAAKGNRLDLDFLVPQSVGKMVEVVHDGHNSLPTFNHFQKRFVRLEDGTIAGYNHQFWSPVTGPGYFVVTAGEGEHDGELGIDYTKLPKDKPASWPKITGHTFPIGTVTYGGAMVDWLRGVSAHVSIGRAIKFGRPVDAYFALVRKDAS
jgi:hypothetical protein